MGVSKPVVTTPAGTTRAATALLATAPAEGTRAPTLTDLAIRETTEPEVEEHPDRLHEPGGRGGLLEVFRSRVIVQMLVRRDVRIRYRYSSIGFAWAYVRPTIQFMVYYFILGIVLDLDKRVENFPVYIFSGLCLLHFSNDTLQTASRSIIRNRAIVKKIWVPRDVFPAAAILVAALRFFPQFVILMVGATATGWYFTWIGFAAALAGAAVISVWAYALGLLLAGLNVFLRELQNLLEFTGFLTHWLTPMLKPWTLVAERVAALGLAGSAILALYVWNPLCTGVELFHLAFWEPTVDFYFTLSPHLWTRAWVMLVAGLITLPIAQWVFRRLATSFADEL